jgi:acetyl esterase/lipase
VDAGESGLDPQVRALLDREAASSLPPLYTLSAPQARRAFRETHAGLAPAPPVVAEVRDISIPGPAGAMRARLYRPVVADKTLPGLVYFHGGGWTYGDLDSYDSVCRGIAEQGCCTLVSLDYRLAPENKFPAAVEDCVAATRWIAANAASLAIDARRLAVAGDSAGGNLAAVTALTLRDDALQEDSTRAASVPPLAMQVLIFPSTDMDFDTESRARFSEGYLLTWEDMLWVRGNYLRDERDFADWRASPLRARDFSRLPPACIITAGFDPLRDEGRVYAERLMQAGVAVTYECFEGQIHGFILMGGVMAAANHAVYRIGQALRQRFAELAAGATSGVEFPAPPG